MSNKTDWKDLGLRYIVTAVVAIIFATLSWLIPAQWVETNFNLWGGIAILVLVVILSAFIVFIMNFVLLKKRDDNSKSIFEKHNNLCKNCKMNNTSCSENVVALPTFERE